MTDVRTIGQSGWRSLVAGSALAFLLWLPRISAAPTAPPPPAVVVRQAADGVIRLGAAESRITGPNARVQGTEEKEIAWWTNVNTSLAWVAAVEKPGNYRVELNYCVAGNNNGSELTVEVGDRKLRANPRAGKGFNDYKTGVVGEIFLEKAGDLKVVVKPSVKAREYVVLVRSLVLRPAGTPSAAEDIGGNPIAKASDGSFKLAASEAMIDGANAQLSGPDEKCIAFWKSRDTSIRWRIRAQESGNYRVEMNYALAPADAGGKLAIVVGDQQFKSRPPATKNWEDFKMGSVGEVVIPKAGDFNVVIKPLSKPRDYLLNLRSLNLVPVEVAASAPDIRDQGIAQAPDGTIRLTALDAEIDGVAAKLEGGDQKHIVWWSGDGIPIKWPVKVEKPGVFTVEFTYALASTVFNSAVDVGAKERRFTATADPVVSDSSPVTVKVAGQTLDATFKSGNGLDDYKTEKCGEIAITKAGDCEIALTSAKERGGLVMHLRSVTFTPKAKE